MWAEYFNGQYPSKFEYDIENGEPIHGNFHTSWIEGICEGMKVSRWCNLAIQYLLTHPNEKFVIYPDASKCGVGISVKRLRSEIMIQVSFKTAFTDCEVVICKQPY